MLINRPQIHIFTKDVELATGGFVRAYFAVIDTAGFREIKFLGTKPIEAEAPIAKTLLLAAPKIAAVFGELFTPSYFEAVSPFYTLDFLTCQLARAPSAR